MRKVSAPKSVTLRALNRATLARQMLLAREKITVARAAAQVLGLQAQWPKPPYVGLFSRLTDFKREDLSRALLSAKVVRATMWRGTIHTCAAEDYLAYRATMKPLLVRAAAQILKNRSGTLDLEAAIRDAREFFLEGPHTFTEVRDFLVKKHPKADERAMGYAVRLHLSLVMVPTETDAWAFPQDAKFALAESVLKKAPRESKDAVARLAIRYLEAFGPATPGDFTEWSGIRDAKPVFESLRDSLVAFADERGRELFDTKDAPRPDEDALAPARFLPEFDSVVLAHTDRTRFVATAHRPQVFLNGLRIAPTILVDGFAAGTWSVEKKAKTGANLIISPFAALSKIARRELEEEAAALVRFMEPDARSFDVTFVKPA